MISNLQATDVLDVRQRQAAELGVLVAKINAAPEEAGPVVEAFERVLDIASFLPGGQQALIDGLRSSSNFQEILAFCNCFCLTVGAAANMGDAPEAVQDEAFQV